jgi:2-polyprenyl-6-methoxyphenol hydroxylase-like FAD-dependent oxidoreductase
VAEAEVVVVGAGPSGATAALLLARKGHRVVVIDRARFPRDKACGEGLLPPGVEVIRRLGLLDTVLATGAQPLEGVTYQHEGGGPSAYAAFPPPPSGGPVAGLGIRRLTFDAILVEALRAEPNVTVREGQRVTGVRRDDSGAVTGVNTGKDRVNAAVVIGADGLHSSVRSLANLAIKAPLQPRYGLVGHWRIDTRDRRGITVTLGDGHEWYEAAVGPDLLLVSTLTRQSTPPISARTYEDAARAAVPAIRGADLVSIPLGASQFRQRARTVAEDGVFLVGDSSGYDDPTIADGLNVGLRLAERAALRIDASLSGRITAAEAVARYRNDHARIVREPRRLARLALLMIGTPWMSRRAVGHASSDPRALSKLLAIDCGYQTFADLTPRDWLALGGI